MKNDRKDIIKKLNNRINIGEHILGVAAGSGMTTKYSVKGGADFILALSAGKFRQTGRPSCGSFLCYSNSNEIVKDFATKELLSLITDAPILFGINATDPLIDLEDYIQNIKDSGLAGIVNFPTVGIIDGNFRIALEEEGINYSSEVDAIRIAHNLGLFTLAFVFDVDQAEDMIKAGADIICAHLGFTTGGDLGAKKVQSIANAMAMADEIFKRCDEINPKIIKMIYGGPISSPMDAQYFYDNTACMGFIGGSSFERIPAERAILNTTRAFKRGYNSLQSDTMEALEDVLEGKPTKSDYIEIIQAHIENNYQHEITLEEMALKLHLSEPYLSSKFKNKLGCSFTEYLVRFRINKACKLLANPNLSIREISKAVGFSYQSQFSKIFKKYKGVSPMKYRRSIDVNCNKNIKKAQKEEI